MLGLLIVAMPSIDLKFALDERISVGAVILITLIQLFFRNAWEITPFFEDNEALTITRQFIREVSFGAVIEEILFRGFLWGYLRRAGWHERQNILDARNALLVYAP